MPGERDADGRIEPSFEGAIPLEHISFLQRDRLLPASVRLRSITYALVGLYLGFNLVRAISNGSSAATLLGVAAGGLVAVMLPVWISAWWEECRTQRTRHKVAAWTAGVLLAVEIIGFLSVRGAFMRWPGTAPGTPKELMARAVHCQGNGDLACAESNWLEYLEVRPDDAKAMANLGMVKARRDDHAGAIVQFEKAIARGLGAYDLFAFHARSLAKLGRVADAIDWYYAALAAVPTLVDVRAELAQLLVRQSRHYEALAVLQAFDSQMERDGRPARFTAERISVEDGIRESARTSLGVEKGLRLGSDGGHFFAPVAVGWARPAPFMVDTGATLTSLSQKMLVDTGVRYEVLNEAAQILTADGRSVPARVVVLERLQVGPHVLRDVKAVTCKECQSLLGVSALSKFDMQSTKVRGVEFLSLVPRI